MTISIGCLFHSAQSESYREAAQQHEKPHTNLTDQGPTGWPGSVGEREEAKSRWASAQFIIRMIATRMWKLANKVGSGSERWERRSEFGGVHVSLLLCVFSPRSNAIALWESGSCISGSLPTGVHVYVPDSLSISPSGKLRFDPGSGSRGQGTTRQSLPRLPLSLPFLVILSGTR